MDSGSVVDRQGQKYRSSHLVLVFIGSLLLLPIAAMCWWAAFVSVLETAAIIVFPIRKEIKKIDWDGSHPTNTMSQFNWGTNLKKDNEIKLRSSYRWFLRTALFRDVRVTDCLNRHQLQKHFYLSDTFLPLPTTLKSDWIIPFDERHWPEGFTEKRLSPRWMRACLWLVSALPLLTATLGSLALFAGNKQGGSSARAAANAWMLLCLVFFLLLFVCILRLSFRDASLLRTVHSSKDSRSTFASVTRYKNWLSILGIVAIALQMESFAAEPASYSEQIDIKSFFSVALFDLSWSLEVSRPKFFGVLIAVSVWLSLASALAFLSYLDAKQKVVKAKKKGQGKTRKQGEERVAAATKEQESDEKQDEENGKANMDEPESKGCWPSLGALQQEAGPMLNAVIPNLEIPMALLGKLLFMPIVSTLLSWLRCDYSSEGQWNGEPTVVGMPASPGSLEPMVCWSTGHMPYAVAALVAVCLYVPTVAIVVPSFIQNLDGSSEIQFTGAYTLLEMTFKLILVVSKTFSGSPPVYLACAVLTSSADIGLLMHKKWEFAKCSIWYFTKFKAFFSSLVLCSALVSLVAGELPNPRKSLASFFSLSGVLGGLTILFFTWSIYFCVRERQRKKKQTRKLLVSSKVAGKLRVVLARVRQKLQEKSQLDVRVHPGSGNE